MAIVQPNSIERDASIQRFKFTFEAVWKAAKQWLYDVEGLDVGSPKSVIRTFREIGLFDEETTVLALQMVNDRNLTVHTYNEAFANEIYSKLTLYAPLLKNWISAPGGGQFSTSTESSRAFGTGVRSLLFLSSQG